MMIDLFCVWQAHEQSLLGQPIEPTMDEMPDATDLGASDCLPA